METRNVHAVVSSNRSVNSPSAKGRLTPNSDSKARACKAARVASPVLLDASIENELDRKATVVTMAMITNPTRISRSVNPPWR
ncbi:hypothetical protein N9F34_03400 [Alphaproteobacteria bacterium]|nr:hypothetical protein [Alphaproteobacteria bacterium]